MKTFLLVFTLLLSFSASAKVCQMTAALDVSQMVVILTLTDKEEGAEVEIDETATALVGGNPEGKNCDDLEADLRKRELIADLEGTKIPIRIERAEVNCNEKDKMVSLLKKLPKDARNIQALTSSIKRNEIEYLFTYKNENNKIIEKFIVDQIGCEILDSVKTKI